MSSFELLSAVPLEEIAKFIAEKLAELRAKPDDGAEIEIEARIGQIRSNVTGRRLILNTLLPVLFKRMPKNTIFDSTVDANTFYKAITTMNGNEKYTEDIVHQTNKLRKIIQGDKEIYQEKIKMATMDVYLPGWDWDVRISISKEIPRNKPEGGCIWTRKRIRKRKSFISSTRIADFTEVKAERNTKATTYEIEWEMMENNNEYSGILSELFEWIRKIR